MKDVAIVFTCAFGISITVTRDDARPGGLNPFDMRHGYDTSFTPENLRAAALEIEQARALITAAEVGS